MAEILVTATDSIHPDPVVDEAGSYKRGYPVVCMPDGHPWGNAERDTTRFVIVRLPGVDPDTIRNRTDSWVRTLDMAVVSSDLATDVHRLRLWSTTASATGKHGVTREAVEEFLERWNAVVVSIAANEVRFDVDVYRAIASAGFWERPVDGVAFEQVAYSQSQGGHRVKVYVSGAQQIAATRLIQQRGAVVRSFDAGSITFDVARATVRDHLIQDVKRLARIPVRRRRYRIQSAEIDAILAAGGEKTYASAADLIAVLEDGMAE